MQLFVTPYDYIEMDVRKMWYDVMGWVQLPHDRVQL